MKKSKKILIVVLVLIILSGASIGVGIYLNKKGKNVTVTRMSTVSQEKTFGNITVTVLPEIIGTWYESSTYNSEGENDHILTISEIYQGSIIGKVCLKAHEYYIDFKTTKIEEGIYKIESNEFCVTLEGTLEVTEKAINLKIDKVANDATSDVKALEGKTIKFDKVANDATSDVKALEGKTIKFDYEDQKIFERIFSTTAGIISISSGPYEGINMDNQYSILKSEIIELLNECVTSTYTVDGGSFSTPKECSLLLNMGEHNIITIDTRDIFIPCDENDPIVIFEMIRDQIYYHIVDTTEHKDVREALNNIVNTSVKLIEEDQKIFERIFSTTAGTISISSGPYEGINRDDQYSILKSEIIELLNECVTSTYTVDGGSFSTPKECSLLLNMGEHNIITIDTRDIFIPCDENDPIVIFEMIRDQIYYHIVDTTEHKDVREALNNIVNTSVKLIEEEYYN